jgi:hypothetical protein
MTQTLRAAQLRGGTVVRRGGRNGTLAGKAAKMLPYSRRRALCRTEYSAYLLPFWSQWNWTFTRPYRSVQISLPEGPTTIAVCKPATRGLAVRRGGRNGTRSVQYLATELRPLDDAPLGVPPFNLRGATRIRRRIRRVVHQFSFTIPPFTFNIPPPSTVPLMLAFSSIVVPPRSDSEVPACAVSPVPAFTVSDVPASIVTAPDALIVMSPVT